MRGSEGEPTRVAVLVPSLRGGGLERVVRDMVLGLGDHSIRPAVFCLGGLGVYAESLVRAGVDVVDCQEGRLRLRGLNLRLIRALRDFGPALIHAHSGTWYPAAVARAILRRPALVYTEHGRYPPEPRTRALVERGCAAVTDRIVAVSEPVARYLSGFLGLPSVPETIPNGIDVSRYAAGLEPRERSLLRRELGLADDDVAFSIVARLTPVKNHAGLLQALAEARESVPTLRLLVVGSGPLEPELRDMARRLDLASSVRFLGFRDDVPRILAASDAFVLASHTEGLPLSVLEALAAGLPVVGPDVGGIASALGDPPAGIAYEPGRNGALARALAVIGGDAQLRERLASMASTRTFDVEAMTARYARLFREVLVDRATGDHEGEGRT